MGTENSKIHPKRAPRSLLGVVFFRLRDLEGHDCLTIGIRRWGTTTGTTGRSHRAVGYRVSPFTAIVTESEIPTTCFLGFCQVPKSTSIEFHGDGSVDCLRGNTKTT